MTLLFGVSATIFANNLFSTALENLTALVKCKNCKSKGTHKCKSTLDFRTSFKHTEGTSKEDPHI